MILLCLRWRYVSVVLLKLLFNRVHCNWCRVVLPVSLKVDQVRNRRFAVFVVPCLLTLVSVRLGLLCCILMGPKLGLLIPKNRVVNWWVIRVLSLPSMFW